jgi:hypothetical protein
MLAPIIASGIDHRGFYGDFQWGKGSSLLRNLTTGLANRSPFRAVVEQKQRSPAPNKTFSSSKKASTVQISLANLMSSMGSQNWGGIMATALIITLPVVVFFAVIQKNLIAGLTQGAVKG